MNPNCMTEGNTHVARLSMATRHLPRVISFCIGGARRMCIKEEFG